MKVCIPSYPFVSLRIPSYPFKKCGILSKKKRLYMHKPMIARIPYPFEGTLTPFFSRDTYPFFSRERSPFFFCAIIIAIIISYLQRRDTNKK